MIPTYVFGWPTGKETGDFLALDLGVSLLSICLLFFFPHPFAGSHQIIIISFQHHNFNPDPTLTLSSAGGTNLRVCLVTLQGSGQFEITQSKYRLSEEQKNGDGQDLFDFCAECLKTFVETNFASDGETPIQEGQVLPLGFTVSVIVFLQNGPEPGLRF